MCEQVIMNEEFENEKAIKHRKRLIGKYSVDRYVGSISQGFFGLRLKYAGGNISNFIIVLLAQFRYFQIQRKKNRHCYEAPGNKPPKLYSLFPGASC